MYKQVTPYPINNYKPILTIRIIKFQSTTISIVLYELLWLLIWVRLLMLRLLIVLIILRVVHHLLHVHVVISGVLWWIILAHWIGGIHVLLLLVILTLWDNNRYVRIMCLMLYIAYCMDSLYYLLLVFIKQQIDCFDY